jgi:hypothetical protein
MKSTTAASILAGALFCATPALANPWTFSGNFIDPANTAVIGSGVWTGSVPPSALFGDDWDIANNVALYTFNVPSAQNVRFDSNGVAAGGADPYFTLFAGTGDAATFSQSNYVQAFSTGGDFDDTYALAAGDYTVAMAVFANMSFAENAGTGTLGDGFVGLGDPTWLGNYYYELVVTLEGGSVPEPSTLALLAVAAAAAAAGRRRSRPVADTRH